MQIKIKDSPTFDLLKPIAGKWVEVETEHLYTNQYNTVPFEGCPTGARVMDEDVDMVIEDARVGKGKCVYCGTMIQAGKTCKKYKGKEKCAKYGVEWFTKKNTYFLTKIPPNSIRFVLSEVDQTKGN